MQKKNFVILFVCFIRIKFRFEKKLSKVRILELNGKMLSKYLRGEAFEKHLKNDQEFTLLTFSSMTQNAI